MAKNLMKYCIFWDLRVRGNMPHDGHLVTQVLDAGTPLQIAFAKINFVAKSYGKLKALFIIAHGIGRGIPVHDALWYGGGGVRIGREDLTAANVSAWSAIKDSVEYIVLYVCGAAYTGPAALVHPGTLEKRDGKSLMLSLAKYTNAVVFAGESLQWYAPSNLNFGNWEGTVYMFDPAGMWIPHPSPPSDLSDIY